MTRTHRILASSSIPTALRRACWATLMVLACAQPGCGQAKDGFHAARQLVVDGKYAEGDAALRKLIADQPHGKFASRAGLFLFKTSVAQHDLDEARKWCQWTIDNHPQSLEAHKCEYKLGMLELMNGKRAAARERFEVLANQPDGPLAAESEAMVQFLRTYRVEPENEPGG